MSAHLQDGLSTTRDRLVVDHRQVAKIPAGGALSATGLNLYKRVDTMRDVYRRLGMRVGRKHGKEHSEKIIKQAEQLGIKLNGPMYVKPCHWSKKEKRQHANEVRNGIVRNLDKTFKTAETRQTRAHSSVTSVCPLVETTRYKVYAWVRELDLREKSAEDKEVVVVSTNDLAYAKRVAVKQHGVICVRNSKNGVYEESGFDHRSDADLNNLQTTFKGAVEGGSL